MDRGTWWATVHGFAESDMTEHTHIGDTRHLWAQNQSQGWAFKGQHTRAFTWERWDKGSNWRESYYNNQTEVCWEGLRKSSISTSTHLPPGWSPSTWCAEKGNMSWRRLPQGHRSEATDQTPVLSPAPLGPLPGDSRRQLLSLPGAVSERNKLSSRCLRD